MRRYACVVLSGMFVFGSWCGEAFAQLEVVQGKQSVFANTYVWDLEPPGSDPVITVTIPRAKKKRILIMDATMISNEFGPVVINTGVLVNGEANLPVRPSSGVIGNCSAGEFGCTVSGHWYLDLDAAEAASPGTVINKPLTIDLYANEENGVGAAEVSLRAWMMKK